MSHLAVVLVASASAQEPTTVVITRVIEAKISTARRVVGDVQPLKTSTIGSAMDGRVVAFYVDQGMAVKKGQALAQLRTATLQIELAAARAEHELYKQQLAELENGERPETIAEAEANMLMAKSAMNNAQDQLKRIELLSASNAASDSDLDDARTRAETTRQSYRATSALLQRLREGPRHERIAQARAQVELRAQRIKLIEDRIAKHTIVAPFDGYVAEENTEVGAWIARGDPVCQLIQLNKVEVRVPATAEYAVQLRRGDTVRVEFPELPDKLFTGSIDRIVPAAKSRVHTFPVFIRMDNELRNGEPLLKAGMLARVQLPAGQRQKLPLVPKDALVLNGQERAVYVVELAAHSNELDGNDAVAESISGQTGSVQKVPVALGVAAGSLIQVTGDVRADDWVVIIGNERLTTGSTVRIGNVVQPDTMLPVSAEATVNRDTAKKGTQ